MDNLIPSRNLMKTQAQKEILDVIIIGGGVTGAGIARDATLRGLQSCLLEKDDFASGTSSMTSKMLHGGLRYLQTYEFRLVRHAALERKVHLEIAPHLAEVLEFIVPLYDWNKDGLTKLRLGLFLYDWLAFPKQIGKHKILNKEKLLAKLSLLGADNIKGGASYHDVKTNDARLTLANVLSAAAGGSNTLNYTEALSWETKDDIVIVNVIDRITQEKYQLKGKVLILSTGPWTQIVEKKGINFTGKAKLRLTRGTHIILKKRLDKNPCTLMNDDGRPIFLLPRLDYDLAGTTDIDYEGSPDDVKPTKEEVKYILNACNRLFPTANYTMDDVIASFSGVRPLVYQEGKNEKEVSRDHSIFVDKENKVITVVGGKLTTYRRMSKEAINHVLKLIPDLPNKIRCMTDKLPLWGGEIDDWEEFLSYETIKLTEEFGLNDKTSKMLIKWYGSEIEYFKEYIRKYGSTKLIENRPWLTAQLYYSCQVELIQNPIDFLRRRLPLMFEEGNGLNIVEKVAQLMAELFSWTEDDVNNQIKVTKEYISEYIQIK